MLPRQAEFLQSVRLSKVCWKIIRSWKSLRWQSEVEIDADTVKTVLPEQFSDLWYINHLTIQWWEACGARSKDKEEDKRIWKVGTTGKGTSAPSDWWGKLNMGEQMIEEVKRSEDSVGIWGRGQNPILSLYKEKYG